MSTNRREFLKRAGWLTATGVGLTATPCSASSNSATPADPMGVLVDLTECVGCRLCEYACKKANNIDAGPMASYDDQSVFADKRRPEPNAFTVVNQWQQTDHNPVNAKINCMHCNHAACVSACIVGAIRKRDNGAVTYDAYKCIGCRYCMAACPFQIPAYEYDDVFTPEVRKCEFCYHRTTQGQLPGCVKECPRQVLTYGKRHDLIELAHEKIAKHPDRYVDHLYGEHEVGGTSWMYLSPVAFEQVGFLTLASAAPPALTETIQHSVFKYGLPPVALYGLLGLAMALTKPKRRAETIHASSTTDSNQATLDDSQLTDAADAIQQPMMAGAVAGTLDAPGASTAVIDDHESQTWQPVDDSISAHDDSHEHAGHGEHPPPAPVNRKLLTPGVFVLLSLIAVGAAFGAYRFLFGLEASTNLDQQHPWGLWIGIDIASGVALAAGGFTSAALAHVFHREHYHAIARPALLTAMLGYTFVALGLQADLGRYYNVWHALVYWQGNSVLFEVGTCVVCYLTVLYLEFAPIVCERLMAEHHRFPRIARLAEFFHGRLERIMFLLVIAGCVLSCLHQSSLGTLLVITPTKLHPLWWTPWSPLLFLLSAIGVGFPMVIWESLYASWSLKLKPEMDILGPLARYIPVLLGIYLALKIWDMIHRGTYVYLDDGSLQSICWLLEVGAGVVLPIIMMLIPRVRRSPKLLFTAASLAVLGVMFNRINVFLIGYKPPYEERSYFPSIGEFAITIGLISALILIYRLAVTFLPVISHHRSKVPT